MNVDQSSTLDQNNGSSIDRVEGSSEISPATAVCRENAPVTDNDSTIVDTQSTSDDALLDAMFKKLICSYCSKKFGNAALLRKHLRSIHKCKTPANKPFPCAYCEETFVSWRHLEVHCEKVHQQPLLTSWIDDHKDQVASKDKSNIKCIECDIKYGNLQMLHEHLSKHHNLNYVEKEISFPNMIAFKKWKLDIERRDRTFFYATYGIQKGSKCNRCLYRCHRSGISEDSDRQDKHKMNNDADSIGTTCTATMTVCEYAHEVRVKYCLQHYGHWQGTTLVQLSPEEQAAVYENVSRGIPLQEQLDGIKNAQSLAEYFQAQLIKTKDVRFLNSAFTSDIYNAGMSAIEYVEQWVRVCSEMEDSPILLYRQEGFGTKTEDLMLIIMTEFQRHILITSTKEVVCLDTNRGIKKDSHFLTTLVVMDDQDVAFPVAFCISSKMDKSSMLEFLSSVKESTGPLSFLYFMSNEDKMYYDAWKEVMQDESKWIWSIWSFEDNIRKHMVRLLKDVPTRQTTYPLLRKIMECNNRDVFVTMLKHFISSLSNNPLCNDFGKFFESQYGSNQEMWACCYRKDLRFSTNFCLEYLHKTLLHCVSRSRNKQLDKFLMVLMKYLRFKMIDRLSNMLDEEKIDLAKKTITVCHNMGLDIECENINSISGDKIWLISSENEVDAYVTREHVSCPELCDLRCPDCDVCVHMYSCTCVQSMINANMCKHIHAVVWKFLTPHFSLPASPVQDSCDNIGDIPDGDPGTPDKDPDLLQSVLKRIQTIYDQVQMNKGQLYKNSLSEVLRLLDRCYQICSNVDISFSFESKSTQTDVVSSVNSINSIIKTVSSSNSENIAPIPVSQSNFKAKSTNLSKMHEKSKLSPKSSVVPGFLAVKRIALGSGGISNPTSIILVQSDRNCKPGINASTVIPVISSNAVLNNASYSASSSERQKHVSTSMSSTISNPILSVVNNTLPSEKQRTVAASSDVANSPSTSKRPQKRIHVSPCPVQDSTSKSQPVSKRHRLNRINFPNVSSSVTTNSSSITKTTIVSSIPASKSSDLTTNSSDKICSTETSDKVSNSACKMLNPSSSKNQTKTVSTCVLSSIYSIKNATNIDNNMDFDASVSHSPLSFNQLESEDSVSKKSKVVKPSVSSSNDLSVEPVSASGLLPFVIKTEPPDEVEELSVLLSPSSLFPSQINSAIPDTPVLDKASEPFISSSTTSTSSPIVIKYPDSSAIKSNLQNTISSVDATADASFPKIRTRNRLRTCSVCETPGKRLFSIPVSQERYKKWFSALKWNVPPEKLMYVLNNARVCDRHFPECYFTSTLRERLIKFACPQITEIEPSAEVSGTEFSCSNN